LASISIKSVIEIRQTLKITENLGEHINLLFSITNAITMKNQPLLNRSNQNDDYLNRSQAEMQRRFVDLQFKRSELEKQLKIVNEVLFSLGREMEQHFSYNQLYK